jgi:hypothetical protein
MPLEVQALARGRWRAHGELDEVEAQPASAARDWNRLGRRAQVHKARAKIPRLDSSSRSDGSQLGGV